MELLTDEQIENLFDSQLNTACSDVLYGVQYPRHHIESFASEIGKAMKLVEHANKNGFWCELKTPFDPANNCKNYICGFTPHSTTGWNRLSDHFATGSTMQLAICKAFLRWSRDHKDGKLTARKVYDEGI